MVSPGVQITDKDYVLTEGKARGFVKQIVEGLNFIHSRNILHLDIKPQVGVLVIHINSLI